MFHINHYLEKANQYTYAEADEPFKRFIAVFRNGSLGVEIFFVISGFILALPFAVHYLRQGKAVSLRQYYVRRVTRLEPPYFLAMVLCFLLIWHRRDQITGYAEYVSSFKASLLYSHNFFWPRETQPLVNPVAWSLEIEVQFYIMAPLIARIYAFQKIPRRLLLVLPILAKLCIPTTFQLPFTSLLDFFDFFLAGFFLADLYVNQELEAGEHEWPGVAGAIISFAGVWFCDARYLAIFIGLFFYCCFKSRLIRLALSNRWITTIGGMCYSVYLTHWMLITTFGGRIRHQITNSYAADYLIHTLLLASLILIAGATYFKLIERPCMSRDWPMRVFARAKAIVFPGKGISQSLSGVNKGPRGGA